MRKTRGKDKKKRKLRNKAIIAGSLLLPAAGLGLMYQKRGNTLPKLPVNLGMNVSPGLQLIGALAGGLAVGEVLNKTVFANKKAQAAEKRYQRNKKLLKRVGINI